MAYTIKPVKEEYAPQIFAIFSRCAKNRFSAYFDQPLPDSFLTNLTVSVSSLNVDNLRAVWLSNGCLTVGQAALQPFGGNDLGTNPCRTNTLLQSEFALASTKNQLYRVRQTPDHRKKSGQSFDVIYLQ